MFRRALKFPWAPLPILNNASQTPKSFQGLWSTRMLSSTQDSPLTTSPGASTTVPRKPLTWTEYFQHRSKRRLRNQVFTYVGAPAAFIGEMVTFITNYEFDPTVPVFGIDAAFVYFGFSMTLGTLLSLNFVSAS
jgi:hypothetical protein